MKIASRISKAVIAILDLLLAGVVFYLLFNLSWSFAHSMLDGVLVGNDTPFAISIVHWFDRFWPKVPLWFPRQGVGVSMFNSYPMLPTFLVLVISRFTDLSIVQVSRLLSFLVFPITAWGVYLLTKRFSNSRVAGVWAGVFFLMSQASWVFMRLHGIFAQTFSMIFAPFTWLFIDRALTGLWDGKRSLVNRIDWGLGSLFFALSLLAHPVTGLVVGAVVVGYGFLVSIFYPFKTKKGRLVRISKTWLWLGIFMALGVGLSAFWIVPFSTYSALANRDGFNTMGMSQLKEVSLLPATLLGFHDFNTGDLRYDFFFFAFPVLILFAVGLVAALLKNRKIFLLGVITVGALFYTSAPLYLEFLVRPFKYIFTAVYFRALIIVFVLLPLVAAGGLKEGWDLLLGWWQRHIKKFPTLIKGSIRMVLGIVVGVAVTGTAYWMITSFRHRPPDASLQEMPAYGISGFDEYGPTLDDEWKEVLSNPLKLLEPVEVRIDDLEMTIAPAFADTLDKFKFTQFDRIDVSPNWLGGAVVKSDALESTDVSIINIYDYLASLTHGMWGYQAGVFFGHEPLYDDPKLLEELTRWYGVEYAYVLEGWDRIENYKSVGYEWQEDVVQSYRPLVVYRYTDPTGIVELSDKPAILVIGDLDEGAYEQVFKLANFGVIPYDKALVVEGKKYIDSYSLEELKQFEGIILHGYSYKRASAWRMLEEYVKAGGRLFINTGWQFVARDWGSDTADKYSLPQIFPVSASSWKSLEKKALAQAELAEEVSTEFSLSKFADLQWREMPWGMAVAQRQDLKPGALALFAVGDDVLMAGWDVGKGKVVWTGFNIVTHALEYRNRDEMTFMNGVFAGLFDSSASRQMIEVTPRREFPDEVEFTLEEATGKPMWFIWKESFTPNWHLQVIGGDKLELTRVGPGFVLARVPPLDAGSQLVLNYRLSFIEGTGARAATLITILFLVWYIVFGKKFEQWLEIRVGRVFVSVREKMNVHTAEDEDY